MKWRVERLLLRSGLDGWPQWVGIGLIGVGIVLSNGCKKSSTSSSLEDSDRPTHIRPRLTTTTTRATSTTLITVRGGSTTTTSLSATTTTNRSISTTTTSGSGGRTTTTSTLSATTTTDVSPTSVVTNANLSIRRPATASSVGSLEIEYRAAFGNDGRDSTLSDGHQSLWHSGINLNQKEYWQVDLQARHLIYKIEIVFRLDEFQECARRNFEVLASNDPSFSSSIVLAAQGSSPVPSGAVFSKVLAPATPYQYVRVSKTLAPDFCADGSYFNLNEIKVIGDPTER